MASFRRATIDAIFGKDKYLYPGENDDRLLELLENDNSEFEGLSDDEDDLGNEENASQVLEESDREVDEIEEIESEDDSDPDFDIPLSILKSRLESTNKKNYWKKSDSFSGSTIKDTVADESFCERKDWGVETYLSMYLDDSDFENMCSCTNVKYVIEHENKPMNLSLEEIRVFLGATILMSCLKYPRVKMYWAKTTRVDAIAKRMSRDRYFAIRSHLKVVVDMDVSNEAKEKDRLWKIRPILDRIRRGCLSLRRHSIVAIDEQMIPFTGTCAVKQFVKGKPNPEGLKNFVCATPEGLILDFEVYQGKNTFLDLSSKKLGVGPSTVVRLTETLNEESHIFTDRYFTTIPLFEFLLEKRIFATGTIMKSRVPAPVHLTQEKIIQKFPRGFSELTVREDQKICVVQWYDKKSILLASTALGKDPIDECKRWSKKRF